MIKRRGTFLLLAILAIAPSFKGRAQVVDEFNVPDEMGEVLVQASFADTYSLDGSINPFYLRGDFDGDGKYDYAFRVKAKKGGQSGIAIWVSSLHQFVFLGAGVPFKAGAATATDLGVLDYWQVYGKRPIESGVGEGPPPKLLGEAILVGKKESASGLIYWNGKRFVWYQQGD